MSILSGFPPGVRCLRTRPNVKNRSSRPPHEGPAFRTRLSQCARRRVRRTPRQPRHASAQQSLSRDERRKGTNDFAGKKGKFTISRPLAEIFLDTRPNSALKCRQHGASLCRRSYRSTAPSEIGQDKRTSRTPRAPSRRAGTAAPVSGVKLTEIHDHENSTGKRLVAGAGCQSNHLDSCSNSYTDNECHDTRPKTRCHTSVQTLKFRWKTAIFCNFWGRSARLPVGNPGSACRCSNMR